MPMELLTLRMPDPSLACCQTGVGGLPTICFVCICTLFLNTETYLNNIWIKELIIVAEIWKPDWITGDWPKLLPWIKTEWR